MSRVIISRTDVVERFSQSQSLNLVLVGILAHGKERAERPGTEARFNRFESRVTATRGGRSQISGNLGSAIHRRQSNL